MFLKPQLAKLIANHEKSKKGESTKDTKPVVKLFVPWGSGTWLLSEFNPVDNIAFGLCDLGQGSPELGYVSIDELRAIRGPAGLYIERDNWFEAKKTLQEYADEAYDKGRIIA